MKVSRANEKTAGTTTHCDIVHSRNNLHIRRAPRISMAYS